MPYTAPSTVTAGQTYTASAHNVIVNDIIDLNTRYAIVTSSTRPSSPTEGMMIYETDTNKALIYDGSAWVEFTDLDNSYGLRESTYNRLRRYDRKERTTDYSLTTSLANLFSADLSWTADGTSTYKLVVCLPQVIVQQSGVIRLSWYNTGSSTYLGETSNGNVNSGSPYLCIYFEREYQPAAGATTVNFRVAYANAAGGVVSSGNGAGGNVFPSWMAVYGPDITN